MNSQRKSSSDEKRSWRKKFQAWRKREMILSSNWVMRLCLIWRWRKRRGIKSLQTDWKRQCKRKRKMRSQNQERRRRKRRKLQRKKLRKIKSNLKQKRKKQKDKRLKLKEKQKRRNDFLQKERLTLIQILNFENTEENYYNSTWIKSKQNLSITHGLSQFSSKTLKSSQRKIWKQCILRQEQRLFKEH